MENTLTNKMTMEEIMNWLRSKRAIRTEKTNADFWWGRRLHICHSDGSRYDVQTMYREMDDKELVWKGCFGKLVTKYFINGELVHVEIGA